MNEAELHTELQRLFNIVFDLHESLLIKTDDIPITLAMLDHDMQIHHQLTEHVHCMKTYIAYGTMHNIPMEANYIRMYHLFADSTGLF
jgi:ABC-type branched-subunit amino acid transport system ATPase component